MPPLGVVIGQQLGKREDPNRGPAEDTIEHVRTDAVTQRESNEANLSRADHVPGAEV